jgi:hypothetical protein
MGMAGWIRVVLERTEFKRTRNDAAAAVAAAAAKAAVVLILSMTKNTEHFRLHIWKDRPMTLSIKISWSPRSFVNHPQSYEQLKSLEVQGNLQRYKCGNSSILTRNVYFSSSARYTIPGWIYHVFLNYAISCHRTYTFSQQYLKVCSPSRHLGS